MYKTTLAAFVAFTVFLPISVQAQTAVEVRLSSCSSAQSMGGGGCVVDYVADFSGTSNGNAYILLGDETRPTTSTADYIQLAITGDTDLLSDDVIDTSRGGNIAGTPREFDLEFLVAHSFRLDVAGAGGGEVTLAFSSDADAYTLSETTHVLVINGGTPTTETPVTETPVTETPVTETPTTETPVTETPTETPTTETPTETETPVTPAETATATAATRRSSSNSGSGNAVAALVIVGGAWLLNRHNPNARFSAFASPTGKSSYGLHANWQQSDQLSFGFQHHESGLNVDSQQGKDAVNSRSVLTLKYTW